MQKRLLCTVLAIATVLSFAACGNSDSDKEPTPTVAATSAPEKDDLSSAIDKLEGSVEGEDTGNDDTNQTDAIGSTVIVDDENCAFKILSMDTTTSNGPAIEVQLENKTDLNLMYSIDNVSVNGIMCDPYWSCLVEAGNTTTTNIIFEAEELAKLGISEITSMLFSLTVYDDDDWSADDLVSEACAYYPLGKAAATVAERASQSTDLVICDTEECSMVITGFDPDGTLGYTVNAYLKNSTDKNLVYSVDEVYVNGFRCDPLWAASVTANSAAYEELCIYTSDLEKNGITEITELQFMLSVYDEDDWSADYLVEEVFCVYPLGEAAASTHERTPQEGDIVLFDTEECTMIVTDSYMDDVWGYTLCVYLENKTSSSLAFSSEDAYVNGVSCDPYWVADLAPGKKYNTEMTWSNYQLEESEISDVEELTFDILVYDNDNWMLGELIYETFTITP